MSSKNKRVAAENAATLDRMVHDYRTRGLAPRRPVAGLLHAGGQRAMQEVFRRVGELEGEALRDRGSSFAVFLIALEDEQAPGNELVRSLAARLAVLAGAGPMERKRLCHREGLYVAFVSRSLAAELLSDRSSDPRQTIEVLRRATRIRVLAEGEGFHLDSCFCPLGAVIAAAGGGAGGGKAGCSHCHGPNSAGGTAAANACHPDLPAAAPGGSDVDGGQAAA